MTRQFPFLIAIATYFVTATSCCTAENFYCPPRESLSIRETKFVDSSYPNVRFFKYTGFLYGPQPNSRSTYRLQNAVSFVPEVPLGDLLPAGDFSEVRLYPNSTDMNSTIVCYYNYPSTFPGGESMKIILAIPVPGVCHLSGAHIFSKKEENGEIKKETCISNNPSDCLIACQTQVETPKQDIGEETTRETSRQETDKIHSENNL